MVRDNLPSKDIPEKLAEAYSTGHFDDIEKLRAIADRRRLSSLIVAEAALRRALEKPPSLPWFHEARALFQSYRPRSVGDFCVYAILLKRKRSTGMYGLYVGQTCDDRRERYLEHKLGPDGLESIGRDRQKKTIVHEEGTHLLFDLTAGIEGMGCCEAIWLEQNLILKLRDALKGKVRCVEALDKNPKCTRHKPYIIIDPTAASYPGALAP